MLTGLKGAAEYEKLVDVFAGYRDENYPAGRPFSREILRDESIKKLINITTQTKAVFTPQEFSALAVKYPAQKDLLNQIKTDDNGNYVIDVTKVTDAQQTALGNNAWKDISRKTYNILYKFKTARIGMNAQSVAHIMIFLFILIGNIGYFVTKAQQKKA